MTDQVVKVRGADRAARTMRAAGKELTTMDDATAEYGKLLAGAAQGMAPVRTGRYRASIAVRGRAVSATVRYAAAVEKRHGVMGRAVSATDKDADRVYTRSAEHICDQIKGV